MNSDTPRTDALELAHKKVDFETDASLESTAKLVEKIVSELYSHARKLERELAQAENKLKELTKLPMPLPANWDEPFYKETMEQVEYIRGLLCGKHIDFSTVKLHAIASKLEYMAQSFTCTANFVPVMPEVEKLKKDLKQAEQLGIIKGLEMGAEVCCDNNADNWFQCNRAILAKAEELKSSLHPTTPLA